jgi:hypothetical protein
VKIKKCHLDRINLTGSRQSLVPAKHSSSSLTGFPSSLHTHARYIYSQNLYNLDLALALQCYYILMFYMFVCFCMQHCGADGWVGVISPQLVLVCWHENLLGHVWGWCTLEPGLNTLWQIVLSLTVSKAVTPRVLIFVNCLWCLFWNWSFYKPSSLILSLLLGCVGRLCFLSVAISDMRILLFWRYVCKYCVIVPGNLLVIVILMSMNIWWLNKYLTLLVFRTEIWQTNMECRLKQY